MRNETAQGTVLGNKRDVAQRNKIHKRKFDCLDWHNLINQGSRHSLIFVSWEVGEIWFAFLVLDLRVNGFFRKKEPPEGAI
jgi:hypothetical protein